MEMGNELLSAHETKIADVLRWIVVIALPCKDVLRIRWTWKRFSQRQVRRPWKYRWKCTTGCFADIHADCGYVEGHLVKYTWNVQIGKRHRKEIKRGKQKETKTTWLLDFHWKPSFGKGLSLLSTHALLQNICWYVWQDARGFFLFIFVFSNWLAFKLRFTAHSLT